MWKASPVSPAQWPARAPLPSSKQAHRHGERDVLRGSKHRGYGRSGMAHLLEHLLLRAPRRRRTCPRRSPSGARFQLPPLDRTNYFETLPPRTRTCAGRCRSGRPHGQQLRLEEGPRQRDDGGPQRVRGGREQRYATSLQRILSATTTGTARQVDQSARGPTWRTCLHRTAQAFYPESATDRITRCWWWRATFDENEELSLIKAPSAS